MPLIASQLIIDDVGEEFKPAVRVKIRSKEEVEAAAAAAAAAPALKPLALGGLGGLSAPPRAGGGRTRGRAIASASSVSPEGAVPSATSAVPSVPSAVPSAGGFGGGEGGFGDSAVPSAGGFGGGGFGSSDPPFGASNSSNSSEPFGSSVSFGSSSAVMGAIESAPGSGFGSISFDGAPFSTSSGTAGVTFGDGAGTAVSFDAVSFDTTSTPFGSATVVSSGGAVPSGFAEPSSFGSVLSTAPFGEPSKLGTSEPSSQSGADASLFGSSLPFHSAPFDTGAVSGATTTFDAAPSACFGDSSFTAPSFPTASSFPPTPTTALADASASSTTSFFPTSSLLPPLPGISFGAVPGTSFGAEPGISFGAEPFGMGGFGGMGGGVGGGVSGGVGVVVGGGSLPGSPKGTDETSAHDDASVRASKGTDEPSSVVVGTSAPTALKFSSEAGGGGLGVGGHHNLMISELVNAHLTGRKLSQYQVVGEVRSRH